MADSKLFLKQEEIDDKYQSAIEFRRIKQYNFSKHWKKLSIFLNDPSVQRALIKGMIGYCYSMNGGKHATWPGYGKCCENHFQGKCDKHGYHSPF